MSASAITKAKQELIRLNNRAKEVRKKQKEEARQLTNGFSVLGGAAAAAIIDEKFGGNEGTAKIEKIGGVPTNAVIGGAAVATAVFAKKMPMREELAFGGLGMAAVSVYQLVREHVDFE